MRIPSYPSIYNFGHAAVNELFFDPVLVQEKLDGSQISFGWYGDMREGNREPLIRSKGAEVHIGAGSMFEKAVNTVLSIVNMLPEGWTIRGEYLMKPKHNVIAYDRVPNGHIAIYDIETSPGTYMYFEAMEEFANTIGLEHVPSYFYGNKPTYDTKTWLNDFIDRKSFLGGSKIEGIVIKNYWRFGRDKHHLMAKWVSTEFKEVHSKEWKKGHPTHGDIIEQLVMDYKSEARWHKAIIHLEERGELENSPRDIGKLFKEVPADVLKECTEEIKERLFDWAWKKGLSRGITAGLATWYKELLAKRQFDHAIQESGSKEGIQPVVLEQPQTSTVDLQAVLLEGTANDGIGSL